jgi:hypothetical protein
VVAFAGTLVGFTAERRSASRQFLRSYSSEYALMTVAGETGHLYRYLDMTAQAEALYDFVKITIEHELVEELVFLANYDRTRQAVQEIVDMPDRLIDLFIRLCLRNNGRLAENRRESHFGFLTDDEMAGMEHAVREGYAKK